MDGLRFQPANRLPFYRILLYSNGVTNTCHKVRGWRDESSGRSQPMLLPRLVWLRQCSGGEYFPKLSHEAVKTWFRPVTRRRPYADEKCDGGGASAGNISAIDVGAREELSSIAREELST